MARLYEAQQHKVKRGETARAIAKKYGHKEWKVIWEADENRKIAKTRRTPECIEPGDLFVSR